MFEIKEGINKFFIGESEEDILAEITFNLDGKKNLVVDHTYVSESLRGQGIAAFLVLKVIEYARHKCYKIIPKCSYVINFFERHEEYFDILA